jgi:hypothetical protein
MLEVQDSFEVSTCNASVLFGLSSAIEMRHVWQLLLSS